ncbi:MAG TPA: SBBP repeat-containing protein [Oligoflexia bacterium]|nr:SBBP repeat-containing protein [Oligoflexia bacterium]
MPVIAAFVAGCSPSLLKKRIASVLAAASATEEVTISTFSVMLGTAVNDTSCANCLAVDGSGNIYIAAMTAGSLSEANAGSTDVFVLKLDSTGSTVWTRQLGNVTIGAGANNVDTVAGIRVNAAGEVFIAGQTLGSLGEANAGSGDAYVAKLTAAGAVSWIKQFGNVTIGANAALNEDVTGIGLLSGGDVVVGGYTQGNLAEVRGGASDPWIARLDSSTGALSWITQVGSVTHASGSPATETPLGGLVVDGSDNIYLSGRTSGAFGEASAGSNDAWVMKMDSGGTYTWIRQLGNVSVGVSAAGSEFAQSIAIDDLGDILLTGYTGGALDEANAGNVDVFVAKLEPVAGAISWITQLGNVTVGAGASGTDVPIGSTTDSSESHYVIGYSNGNFGEANGGTWDVFIAKFTAVGAYQSVKHYGLVTGGAAVTSADFGRGVYVHSSGKVRSIYADSG